MERLCRGKRKGECVRRVGEGRGGEGRGGEGRGGEGRGGEGRGGEGRGREGKGREGRGGEGRGGEGRGGEGRGGEGRGGGKERGGEGRGGEEEGKGEEGREGRREGKEEEEGRRERRGHDKVNLLSRSTVEVEEEETAEEVAATPPEHEPPPQEQERGGAQPPASESYVQELKAQQEEREKKLREELSDLRTKSRKTATALRAQLAEAQNTHSSEMASLRSEVSSLGDRASDLEQRNATLQAELSQLQAGRESAEAALERSRAAQLDQEAIVQQLRLELSSSAAREAAVIVEDRATAVQAPGLVDRSAQWSELSGQSPPVSQGASPLYRSMVLPPMIPMDEVFHDEPVSTVTTPFQATPLQASLRLTSLDQSVVSLEPPCGSPLQLGSEVSDMPRLPQHSLSMLGRQSRLSHQSPFPQVRSHSHATCRATDRVPFPCHM